MFSAAWAFSGLRILGLLIIKINPVKSRELQEGSFAICYCFPNYFSFCPLSQMGYATPLPHKWYTVLWKLPIASSDIRYSTATSNALLILKALSFLLSVQFLSHPLLFHVSEVKRRLFCTLATIMRLNSFGFIANLLEITLLSSAKST